MGSERSSSRSRIGGRAGAIRQARSWQPGRTPAMTLRASGPNRSSAEAHRVQHLRRVGVERREAGRRSLDDDHDGPPVGVKDVEAGALVGVEPERHVLSSWKARVPNGKRLKYRVPLGSATSASNVRPAAPPTEADTGWEEVRNRCLRKPASTCLGLSCGNAANEGTRLRQRPRTSRGRRTGSCRGLSTNRLRQA